MRDDFDENTKTQLALRVGYRCSNPNCRKLTCGPQENPKRSVKIGVASHISAASPGGSRYDSDMPSDERKSIENGIWLCQNCGKLVDNDEKRYSKDLLVEWKKLSEQAALYDVQNMPETPKSGVPDDIELLRFYSQCLDRPAFQDPFREEGSMEAFDKAIEDTIIAINTGSLRSRDGNCLYQAKGKSFLSNHKYREKMDVIVDLLRAIRSSYALAVKTGRIHLGSRHDEITFYHIRDPETAEWMDITRAEIIRLFSELCKEVGIPILRFPRYHSRKNFERY